MLAAMRTEAFTFIVADRHGVVAVGSSTLALNIPYHMNSNGYHVDPPTGQPDRDQTYSTSRANGIRPELTLLSDIDCHIDSY